MSGIKLCPCGKPLHYSNPAYEAIVEQQNKVLGERVTMTVIDMGRKFLVPRHYIALHGVQGKDLPGLVGRYGIEEIE